MSCDAFEFHRLANAVCTGNILRPGSSRMAKFSARKPCPELTEPYQMRAGDIAPTPCRFTFVMRGASRFVSFLPECCSLDTV